MVECVDCGYLAVRNAMTGGLEEAGEGFREKGSVPIAEPYGGHPHPQHERRPLCFARCRNLRDEIRSEIGSGKPEVGSVLQVIHRERQCEGFTKWQLGFTPKEHREMIDRKWERKWRIIEGVIFLILAGLFTLLGAYIVSLN